MLREIRQQGRKSGETRRRWFSDERMDLILWYADEKEEITGFQLCYDKPNQEHALTWRRDDGFQHHRIDNGENVPGEHKQSPILLADGFFPQRKVSDEFARRARGLDPDLIAFVLEQLKAYEPSRDLP